jgi:hypothetical protein
MHGSCQQWSNELASHPYPSDQMSRSETKEWFPAGNLTPIYVAHLGEEEKENKWRKAGKLSHS